MIWLVVAGVVAVSLFSLAWWSSGRAKARLGKPGMEYRNDAQARALEHGYIPGAGNDFGLGGGPP